MTEGPGRRDERGMTLMELTFLVMLLSFASFIFSRFILSTRDAVGRQEAAQYLLQSEVRTTANLDAGLNTSVELLADYADGTSNALLPLRNLVYTSVKDATKAANSAAPPAPVAFSLWPTVETESQVDMNGPTDSGAPAWGNELAYVAALNPVTFTAYYQYSGGTWSVTTASTSTSVLAEVISVGRYQLVYDYLSYYNGSYINSCGPGVRLTEWRSQPLVNYSSLSSLSDTPGTYTGTTITCCPRLLAACSALTADGYGYAFNPQAATQSASCASCFYPLTDAAIGNDSPTTLPVSLTTASWGYLDDFDLMMTNQTQGNVNLGRISRADGGAGGESSGKGGYSIAFNVTGSPSQTSVKALQGPGGVGIAVPAYAELNQLDSHDSMGGTGFPGGFEVGIGGQEGSREIFVRLVMMASNAGSTGGRGVFQALSSSTEVSVAPTCDF